MGRVSSSLTTSAKFNAVFTGSGLTLQTVNLAPRKGNRWFESITLHQTLTALKLNGPAPPQGRRLQVRILSTHYGQSGRLTSSIRVDHPRDVLPVLFELMRQRAPHNDQWALQSKGGTL